MYHRVIIFAFIECNIGKTGAGSSFGVFRVIGAGRLVLDEEEGVLVLSKDGDIRWD